MEEISENSICQNKDKRRVIKYVPENYTMDGIRCDIAIGFGQLGKIIATENTCDNLMDERELAKYIVDNETISENENIECRR